jgi:hypothetical protein
MAGNNHVMNTLDEILAECLTDIESGEASLEQCLELYPEHAQDLRPLLQTAQSVRQAPTVEPSAAFQSVAPTRLANLMAAHRRPEIAQRHPDRAPSLRRLTLLASRVAVVVIMVTVLLAGTAYASQGSLPDGPLYPLKRTIEQVRVTAARSDMRRARVFVGLLDERARETAAMAERGNLQRSAETGGQYARLLLEAEMISNRVPAQRPEGRKLLTLLRDRLVAQQAILQHGVDNAPERGKQQLRMLIIGNQRLIDRLNRRLPDDTVV